MNIYNIISDDGMPATCDEESLCVFLARDVIREEIQETLDTPAYSLGGKAGWHGYLRDLYSILDFIGGGLWRSKIAEYRDRNHFRFHGLRAASVINSLIENRVTEAIQRAKRLGNWRHARKAEDGIAMARAEK